MLNKCWNFIGGETSLRLLLKLETSLFIYKLSRISFPKATASSLESVALLAVVQFPKIALQEAPYLQSKPRDLIKHISHYIALWSESFCHIPWMNIRLFSSMCQSSYISPNCKLQFSLQRSLNTLMIYIGQALWQFTSFLRTLWSGTLLVSLMILQLVLFWIMCYSDQVPSTTMGWSVHSHAILSSFFRSPSTHLVHNGINGALKTGQDAKVIRCFTSSLDEKPGNCAIV